MIIKNTISLDEQERALALNTRCDENEAVSTLLSLITLDDAAFSRIHLEATRLVSVVREHRLEQHGIDAFLYEYDLSTDEGITLMCLAEAFLRIPDKTNLDKLVKDKLTSTNWGAKLGGSDSMWVNTATWALMLTGKVLASPNKKSGSLTNVFKKLIQRSGEPVIRKAVQKAMQLLSSQFVMGKTIEAALKRAVDQEKKGYRYSYDMLGEAAHTEKDAIRYFTAYQDAIKIIGQTHQGGTSVFDKPGISVKISALHPRYEFAQQRLCHDTLVARLKTLAELAKEHGIGLTIDAEESYRLELSLSLIKDVFRSPSLAGWEGFGVAVQAYQKRAPYVLDTLAALAKEHKRRIKVRLVKGAYWDSEIKLAQEEGQDGYPVYTRKATTDVSYLACATKMASMTDAFYPQFATHNAHSIAAIKEIMQDKGDYEFQCLHGMGHSLYDHIVGRDKDNIPCRVYAPVGKYEDLLPYLVRRLLENGANTSFVNRVIDTKESIDDIVANPVAKVAAWKDKAHPQIPLPQAIYGDTRKNSLGLDLTNPLTLNTLESAYVRVKEDSSLWQGAALIANANESHFTEPKEIISPFDKQAIGHMRGCNEAGLTLALENAKQAQAQWAKTPVAERAAIFHAVGEKLQERIHQFMALASFEAGKTLSDAVAEVREAIDFCHYYASLAVDQLSTPTSLVGYTGETNALSLHPRGTVLCISPWNFPLAIFLGQVSAALLTGNCVLAKPAESTSLIAYHAVKLLRECGVPEAVCQLIPARGSVVGKRLVADDKVDAVMLTGSTETARTINQTLANRQGAIVPLVAETGGMNCMIVGSSALTEQVCTDVLLSAFGSAGQRCSALRVLYVQEEVADKQIDMLKGAMNELVVGLPYELATDVGPVIDESAYQSLMAHIEKMKPNAKLHYQAPTNKATLNGYFVPPTLLEIDSISQLEQEVFGPVLHVIRYKLQDLDQVLEAINQCGYGLTLGIHSRINSTIEHIIANTAVGNTYVNRNMIGAMVGVQPFGGEGLSGTGPKAGGPNYLKRLCVERTVTINTTATGGNATLMSLEE